MFAFAMSLYLFTCWVLNYGPADRFTAFKMLTEKSVHVKAFVCIFIHADMSIIPSMYLFHGFYFRFSVFCVCVCVKLKILRLVAIPFELATKMCLFFSSEMEIFFFLCEYLLIFQCSL